MHPPSRFIRWHRHQDCALGIERILGDWAVGLFFAVIAFAVLTHV